MSPTDDAYIRAAGSGDTAAAGAMVAAAAHGAGYTIRAYHGTDEARERFDGGAFFTDSARDAADYAQMRALRRAIEEDDSLAEVVYDVLAEEGGEELTDLGPSQIRDIAEANGFDLPDDRGAVLEGWLRIRRPLDITGLGTDAGDLAALWSRLHRLGLLEPAWGQIDADARVEMADRYRGKALYRFLEEEGVQARAFEMGFDAVVFADISPGGGASHTTWLTRDASQFKSAAAVVLDDAGNIVPLSRRFDPGAADIRGRVDPGERGFPAERTLPAVARDVASGRAR